MPVFYRKTGFSEYLRCKYSDSPRPSGTPLINAGGKKSESGMQPLFFAYSPPEEGCA